VPWLRRSVTGLSSRRPRFFPTSVHVRFVVDKVTLGQVFLQVLRSSPVRIIPPVLHTVFIYMLLLPEGQTGKPWEPSKKQCSFRHGGSLDRKVLSPFSVSIWLTANVALSQLCFTGGLPSHWQRDRPLPQLSWLPADGHDTARVTACSGLLARAHAA
jgi:hypothetical protein